MQSFGDCRKAVREPSEAVHSTKKKVGKAEDKVFCFAQKIYQEEWPGEMSGFNTLV